MKSGDPILYSGWRYFDDGIEMTVVDEPATLISIDRLSEIGCYPDRYTIEFIDGVAMDCVLQCISSVNQEEAK